MSIFSYICINIVSQTMSRNLAPRMSSAMLRPSHENSGLFMLMEEIWKDIPDFEGLYKASNLGRIMSLHYVRTSGPRIMKQRSNRRGYKHIQLKKNGTPFEFGVHVLVARAFIPPVEGKNQIDHIDGNPSNNNVQNLRWCTPKENSNNPIAIQRHREAIYKIGIVGRKLTDEDKRKISESRKGRFTGKDNPFYGKHHTEETRKKISKHRTEYGGIAIVQLSLSGDFIREWQGAAYAAKALGITSSSSITECCRGKRKTIGGYKWKYKTDYEQEKKNRD